jgi:hypothetical protein
VSSDDRRSSGGHDREPQAQHFGDFRDGRERGVAAGRESLVDRLAADAGLAREFADSDRARDFSERSRDDFGIAVLERCFEVGRTILGSRKIIQNVVGACLDRWVGYKK